MCRGRSVGEQRELSINCCAGAADAAEEILSYYAAARRTEIIIPDVTQANTPPQELVSKSPKEFWLKTGVSSERSHWQLSGNVPFAVGTILFTEHPSSKSAMGGRFLTSYVTRGPQVMEGMPCPQFVPPDSSPAHHTQPCSAPHKTNEHV